MEKTCRTSVLSLPFHGAFHSPPITGIHPDGWCREWLRIQAHGLTGNLQVAGFPFNTDLWIGEEIPHRSGAPWWPYEQTAYWVDGVYRCGLLLGDERLIERGRAQCQHVLQHADETGYLGPKSCKPYMVAGRWSHAIFFRALMVHAEASGMETEIAQRIEAHFLGDGHDHSGHRDVCCIEAMAWAALRTGNQKLVQIAMETWENYQRTGEDDDISLKRETLAMDEPAECHGVTFCETFKQSAILYLLTGDERLLQDAENAVRKIDRHHMLVTGAPSSTESLRGVTALDAHETCDIADYTWSAIVLLEATGKADYADKIERAIFNAHPAAVTKDFRGLQYFSSPNQLILTDKSNHTLAATGSRFMSYRPMPGTECCTGQVPRIFPNFIANAWMLRDKDPVAALYAPGRFNFAIGDAQISIHETTDYPFGETVVFDVETTTPVSFTLWLRVPGWCDNAGLSINGESRDLKQHKGDFFALERQWNSGDRVELRLPMPLRLSRWPEGGVAVERGPLVFALPVADRRQTDANDPNQSVDFPAWNMWPDSDWNYGLESADANWLERVKVQTEAMVPNPWQAPPVRLVVPAKKIPGWQLRETHELDSVGGKLIDPARNKWLLYPKKVTGDFIVTPPLPSPELRQKALHEEEEFIELVPIGATCLRVGIFPEL